MTDNIRVAEVPEIKCMAIRMTVTNDRVGEGMGKIYGEIAEYAQNSGVFISGPPFAYYHSYDMEKTDMECGFQVMEFGEESGRIKAFTLPAGKAVTAMHVGPYDKLMGTYVSMEKYMQQNGLEPAGPMWEIYISDPQKIDPSELMTQVFWLIKE